MRHFFAVVAALLALPAFAQTASDPPGRVARLSLIEGEVSMAPAGTQEWGEAVLNRPLTSEDRLFVDLGARAELQVGSATIHLDSATEFAFIELDDDAMAMSLIEGNATIRILRKREREEIEVSTPNASIALLHPGEYHIEVDAAGETTVVKARSGAAEVVGENASYTVNANQAGVFRGLEPQGEIGALGARTAFEAWANERAQRNERSASAQHVGEGVIGYEDLDDHGRWVREPEYGYVWYPTHVVAGWAPYRYGRWTWVSPWGWTWIDDARWGFAPSHYGRWAYVRERWCWVPGPRHVRAVYAPALVAWVGGRNVSVNIALGHGVGWFPLGPREIYVPGYWHTRRYIHRVNVSNTIIVNNTYINRAYRGRYRDLDYRYRSRPHAVTVVEREHFVRGRPVGGHVARVDDGELRRWGHSARPPAIAPVRESVLAGQRVIRTSSADRDSRSIATRRALPERVGFETERRAIEANGGRPVTRGALHRAESKDRSDVRIVRGAGAERRGSARTLERAAETPAGTRQRLQTAPAREHGGSAPAIETRRERSPAAGSDAPMRSDVSGRTPREQRSESRITSPNRESPRTATPVPRESHTGGAARDTPRREWSTRGESSRGDRAPTRSDVARPNMERRSERPSLQTTPERASSPRPERSFSPPPQSRPQAQPRSHAAPRQTQPRAERSYSAPQRQMQPRTERAPRMQRSAPNSHGSGRSSSHSRIERR